MKLINRRERRDRKRAKDADRIIARRERNGANICPSCGGRMTWCSICEVYTKTCCVDYGTCMCS